MEGFITLDNVKLYLIPTILILMVFRISRAILSRPKNLPPGPVIIPYITFIQEYFKQMWNEPKTPWERTQDAFRKYGNIVSTVNGSSVDVLITGLDEIREALLKYGDVFNERPRDHPFIQLIGNGAGIMTSNGHLWKTQRTFAVSKLRAFGMGKVNLEGKIMEEIEFYMGHLLSTKSQPIDPIPLTNTAVGNVIFNIVATQHYLPDDPTFTKFRQAIRSTLTYRGAGRISLIPFASYLPGDLTGLKRLSANRKFYLDQIHALINQHRATLDPENVRDFIDTYLLEMEKEKVKNVSEATFSDDQLAAVLADMFFAGTETTTTTIIWSFLFLSLFPEVQRKAQQEIDDVIGRERQATVQDKSKLPYFTALTKELQRMSNIAPFLLPHSTKEDVTFRGYFIPKDSDINFVIGNVMYDPKIWESPNELRPERFLKDRKEYTPEHYIPFGVGRRLCMGDALARMEVYLFMCTILQRFTVKLPEGRPRPSTRPILGFTSMPAPFEVCFEPRN